MSSAAGALESLSPGEATQPVPHPAFGITDVGLVVMAVVWAVNFSVVKRGLQSFPPFTFSALRMITAAVILFVITLTLRGANRPSRNDTVRLLGLGLLGNGFYQLLFIIGMTRTRAGIAALVIAAGPAWIAIVSRLIGHERVAARGWAGIALQLIGVISVVVSSRGLDDGNGILFGTSLIVCGSVLWAVYSVLLQPLTKRVHPLHLAALTMLSGAVLLSVLAIPELQGINFSSIDAPGWGALAYASIGALVIGYLLFYRGVRVLGPTRTAMYGNLQPIIALIVAWIFLHERPSAWQWIGVALIMGGLLVSRTAHMARTSNAATISS